MEKVKNKDKSISDFISEIKEDANIILDYPESSLHSSAENIKKNLNRIYIYTRGLNTLLFILIVLLIIAVSGVFVLLDANDKTNQLNKDLIEANKPNFQDSLKNKILLDQKGDIDYRTDKNGKPITYRNIIKRNDDLVLENIKLKDSLSNLKFVFDLTKETFDIKIITKKEGNNTSYSVKSGVIEQYEKQFEQINNSLRENKEINRKYIDTLNASSKKNKVKK